MTDIDKYMRRVIDSQFREAQWQLLSPAERLNACQQLENRLAAERNAAPKRVYAERMEGKVFGYQRGNGIFVNAYVLEKNAFLTGHGYVPIPAAGWQTYDTICHEDLHGLQEDMRTGQTFTYISPDKNYDIYRIQSDEKYAFAVGQDRTLTAILEQKDIHGLEPDMITYKNIAKDDRYQDRVAEAAESLGIPDIDRELDRLVYDKEHGITPQSPSNDYLKLDNILYGANHPLAEEETSESEGTAGHNGTAQNHQTLSFGSLTDVSSSSGQQHQPQAFSFEQLTQSTNNTGNQFTEEETMGRHR